MTTELQLVKDGRVLYKISIQAYAEDEHGLTMDVDEQDIDKLVGIYSIAANEGRLRMMMELAKRGEMRFSELLKMSTNPKLVKTCVDDLTEAGMLEHEERGSYRSSERGTALAITMTAGLARLLDMLEEEISVE
jgi:DNA-binding HxlR family transcriptional regulator